VSFLKRELYLILIGAAVLALAVVVWVLNRDISSDLLAVVAVLGGVAIVLIALPLRNGGNHRSGQ
jgi:hypothetical protein